MTSKYLKAFRDGSLLTVLVVVSPAHADPLAGYRGKNRLLVVVAETPQNESAAIQRQIYQRAKTGMTDRDVVLVEAIGNDERALAIRARLAVSDRRFRVLLVGKDGNTAASSEMPFTTDDVFGRIDAMPMRKDEVRRQAR